MEVVSQRRDLAKLLLMPTLREQIVTWLKEDIPSFDYGGFVVGSAPQTAQLLCKSPGIVAGVPFFNAVFEELQCSVEWMVDDGEMLAGNRDCCAVVRGPANQILQGERLALNLLSRCSGIATCSAQYRKILADSDNSQCILAGTRKTTPGMRLVEKYGMIVGGIDMHRYDLSSMIMLKDNHIACYGSVTKAIQAARSVGGFSLNIEIEVSSEEEADEAIDSGADVIMLDNFSTDELREVSARLKQKWTGKRNFLLECSGGLDLHNLKSYIVPDIDIYSTSKVHQGTAIIDFSLKIIKSL